MTRLFDTSDFPARWQCGHWTPAHGWLHILSDVGVWAAYFAIPLVLGYFVARRRDLPFRWVFLLFVAFILLCGTTHLMEAVIFWWPAYRLAGVLKLITAIVSWVTVIALVRVAPAVLAMRTPEELEREVAARMDAERRLKDANAELERRVEDRTADLGRSVAALQRERELLRTTLVSIGDAVVTTDSAAIVTGLNTVAEALTGWTDAEAQGQPLEAVFRIVNEATRLPVENPAMRALKEGVIVGLANHTVLIAKDGRERSIDDSAAPIRSASGEVVGCVLVFRDISERKRGDALIAGQKRVLEMVATDAPLAEVLATLALAIEEQEPGLLCAVLLLDDDGLHVRVGAGPSMPEGYMQTHDGLGIEPPYLGPCGMAFHTGQSVVVTDIEADLRWAGEWRNRALANGLRSCRSTPVNGSDGKPMATFAVYRREPGDPAPSDPNVLSVATNLAGIVITRKKQETELRRSEARLRRVFESNVVGMIRWDLDRSLILDANDEFLRMTGYTRDDVAAGRLNFREMTPAEWTPRNEEGIRTIRADGHAAPYEKEYFRKDGSRVPLIIAGTRFDDSRSEGMSLIIDISDRKQAEQEIARLAAESERQRRLYETVLMNTPDFVYVFSLDHKFVYANDALLKMWGRGHEDAIGKTLLEIGYEPWHAEMHDREIDQVRATRQPIRGEVPFVGTSGRRMYDYIFVPIIGADGEVEAVAGTTRDVTERRQAEEQIKANEERQTFLVTLADTLRPLSDPIDVQAEASRVLGEHLQANRVVYFEIRGEEYVIERDYTAGVGPLAGRYPVAAFGPALLAALLDGRTVVEADATTEPDRPTGERAAFAAIQVRGHVDVPLVKGGRFVAGMTVHVSDLRDWTPQEVALIEETAERTWAAVERVRAEVALRTSEERRRLALAAAELGTWQIDLVTNAFTTDERFRVIFAGTIEAMDFEQAVSAIHADDRGRVLEAVAAATRPDDPAPYAEEYRVVHPDGSVRWVFAKGRVHYDRGGTGQLASFDGTVADITYRKMAEVERERLVGQLRDHDRRKDEFLATLAHELRNPLAPIRNGLQVIRMAGANGTIEHARAMMERQLTQLIRLVDDLLDLSRVTSGKLELRRERVELKSVIDAAVETSRPTIEEAGHEFTVAVPDEPIWVDGDLTRLAQVVSNLLNNSAKYTHQGGHIRLAVRRENGTAVLAVADNGIGIPPNMLGKVFEMFTQVDRTLEKTTGGLGIGLSLVKGLVEMHGGTIEARSEGEGRGSEFIVRLPVAFSAVQKIEPTEADGPVVSPSRRRILVTDDNVDSAESLGLLLRLLGNDVRTANDGLQAVDVAETFRPDVILLDIAMPKLNGYEACRRIRDQPWSKNAILVAMTGWGQDEDKRRSQDAGFDHHLVKPLDPSALDKLLAGLQPRK